MHKPLFLQWNNSFRFVFFLWKLWKSLLLLRNTYVFKSHKCVFIIKTMVLATLFCVCCIFCFFVCFVFFLNGFVRNHSERDQETYCHGNKQNLHTNSQRKTKATTKIEKHPHATNSIQATIKEIQTHKPQYQKHIYTNASKYQFTENQCNGKTKPMQTTLPSWVRVQRVHIRDSTQWTSRAYQQSSPASGP